MQYSGLFAQSKNCKARETAIASEFLWANSFSKHVPAAMDMNTTTEELCFLCGPFQDVISKEQG
jgi:hypothetical protein